MTEPTYRYTDEYLFEKMDAAWQTRRVRSRCVSIETEARGSSDASIATPIEMAIDAMPCRTRTLRKGRARRVRGRCLPRRPSVIEPARDRIFLRDPR